MNEMTGGELLVKALKASGVEYVFGMTGGQTPFTASLKKSGIKMMTVRDEKCGSLMATGYSRISGKTGVCTSADIGAAHLCLGMYEASQSSIPVVAITNDPNQDIAWRTGGRFIDLETMFRPSTKWAVRAEVLETLPDIVRKAFRVATAGNPGTVAVIVPNNLLWAESNARINLHPQPADEAGLRISDKDETIEKAAELLSKAHKPAIVAGGGIVVSRASKELLELAELLAIPVATTHIAQGVFPGRHPLSLGVLGRPTKNGRGKVANKIVGEADLVFLVGTKADFLTTLGWTVPSSDSKIMQIDIDADTIGSNYPVELGIRTDAKLALQALNNTLKKRTERVTSVADSARAKEIEALMKDWRDEVEPQLRSEAIPIEVPRIFSEIQKFIDKETILVLDAGSCSYWAADFLDVTPDTHIIHPRGYPALGSGLPMAMGAQVAAPDKRVICVAGDGAFGYNVMELETAVRLGLPVVNIVINNETLGMEWGGFITFAGEPISEALRFGSQNFCEIAKAYNCFAARVEKPKDLKDAIVSALDSKKPSVIDVVSDPDEYASTDVPWGFV